MGALNYNPLAVAVLFIGPVSLWLMTLRKVWPKSVVIIATALGFIVVLLNWAYLLSHELIQR